MFARYPSPRELLIRRLVVLAIVIGLVWGLIAGTLAFFGWVGSLFNQNQAPTIVAGSTCQSQQIKIDAHVGTSDAQDQLAFNPGDTPYFWFSVTNTGAAECKFNLGSDVTFFKVTSGSDNVWSSKDCNAERVPAEPIMLQPNVSMANPAGRWDRVRSNDSGCALADGLPLVTADGASYVLQAEVNGILSTNKPQFVLN
jgi:hypothetical protein